LGPTVQIMHLNYRTKFVVSNLPAARRGRDPFCIVIIDRHSTDHKLDKGG